MPDRMEKARSLFYMIQILLGAGCVGLLVFLRSKGPESGFRVRESDQFKPEGPKFPSLGKPETAPGAQKKARPKPLQLGGIRLDGAPHEILGLPPNPSEAQVQKAYRDLIKRYHPDVVGRPGSREWKDAQQIAEAVNRAKDELLKNLRSRSG